MRLSRKDYSMEEKLREELKEINENVTMVNNSNLNEKSKNYLLNLLEARAFEIRDLLSQIKINIQKYSK